MKIALAIASLGRPQLVSAMIEHWSQQTRPLDQFVLSLSSAQDVGEFREGSVSKVIIGPPGLCQQRNRALDFLLALDVDVVIFADDDYVPSRNFVAGVERLMAEFPDVVVASGRMLADGVTVGGIPYDTAVRLVTESDEKPAVDKITVSEALNGYGCNMVIRAGVDRTVRCDERLPLYGWQEDVDYTRQYRRYGRIVRTNAFFGVHIGTSTARSPGKRLGYSQFVNPIYLIKKGTMPVRLGAKLMVRNFLANVYGAIMGDQKVDRVGRLQGNLLAAVHILTGRILPEYVLRLNR